MKTIVVVDTAIIVLLLLGLYFLRTRKDGIRPNVATNSKSPVVAIAKAMGPCSDAVSSIVLDDLYGKFQYNYLSVWLSHDYDEASWKPRLDREQAEINRIRAWSKTLEDPCFQKHYSKWLDYYQRELDSAWKELRTQSEKKNMEAYETRNQSERDAVNKYRESHDIPRAPRNP